MNALEYNKQKVDEAQYMMAEGAILILCIEIKNHILAGGKLPINTRKGIGQTFDFMKLIGSKVTWHQFHHDLSEIIDKQLREQEITGPSREDIHRIIALEPNFVDN